MCECVRARPPFCRRARRYNYTTNGSGPAPPFINLNSGTAIVNCVGYGSCYGPVVIQAADNTNLEVRCPGSESCRVMSINCPKVGGSCKIDCTGLDSCRVSDTAHGVTPTFARTTRHTQLTTLSHVRIAPFSCVAPRVGSCWHTRGTCTHAASGGWLLCSAPRQADLQQDQPVHTGVLVDDGALHPTCRARAMARARMACFMHCDMTQLLVSFVVRPPLRSTSACCITVFEYIRLPRSTSRQSR